MRIINVPKGTSHRETNKQLGFNHFKGQAMPKSSFEEIFVMFDDHFYCIGSGWGRTDPNKVITVYVYDCIPCGWTDHSSTVHFSNKEQAMCYIISINTKLGALLLNQ